MRYKFFFILSFIFLVGCMQSIQETDLEYRKTIHEFLRLITEGKFDEAKGMITPIPDQVVSTDAQLGLIKKFLDENGVIPVHEDYALDSADLGVRRFYELKLFKHDNSSEFIGRIRISFVEGAPEKISTFMAIGRPVRFLIVALHGFIYE